MDPPPPPPHSHSHSHSIGLNQNSTSAGVVVGVGGLVNGNTNGVNDGQRSVVVTTGPPVVVTGGNNTLHHSSLNASSVIGSSNVVHHHSHILNNGGGGQIHAQQQQQQQQQVQQQQVQGGHHWPPPPPSSASIRNTKNGLSTSSFPPQSQAQQQQAQLQSLRNNHAASSQNARVNNQGGATWSVPNPLASLGITTPAAASAPQGRASPNSSSGGGNNNNRGVVHRQHLQQQQQQHLQQQQLRHSLQQQALSGMTQQQQQQQATAAATGSGVGGQRYLYSNSQPQAQRRVQQQQPQPQQQQQHHTQRSVQGVGGAPLAPPSNISTSSQSSIPQRYAPTQPPQQPKPQSQQQQQQQQQQLQPRRIRLTSEAREALTRAVLSAIRSPTGTIEPRLLKEALDTGLPQSAVLTAAKVARDREMKKKMEAQQQKMQVQQQQQQQRYGAVPLRHQTHPPPPPPQQQQQQQQGQQQQGQFHHHQHHHPHTHHPHHHAQRSPVMTSLNHASSAPIPPPHTSPALSSTSQSQRLLPQAQPTPNSIQYNHSSQPPQPPQPSIRSPAPTGNNNMSMIPSSALATAASLAAAQSSSSIPPPPLSSSNRRSTPPSSSSSGATVNNSSYGRVPYPAPPTSNNWNTAPPPPQQQPQPPHHANRRRPAPSYNPPPPPPSTAYSLNRSTKPPHPSHPHPPHPTSAASSSSMSPKKPQTLAERHAAAAAYAISSNATNNLPGKKLRHLQQMASNNPNSTTTNTTTPRKVKKEVETTTTSLTLEEKKKWKRVTSGLWVQKKEKGCVLVGNSLSGLVRCEEEEEKEQEVQKVKKEEEEEVEREWKAQALLLQKQLQQPSITTTTTTTKPKKKRKKSSTLQPTITNQTLLLHHLLLSTSKHKRYKLQPKKESKLLDKTLRKSRTQTTDFLLRRHKELIKSIYSHQFEFFKFHRLRKAEASKLARSVRDFIDKTEKKKEKDADLKERQRLAALKANDMKAYSKLLEETKNERLKFLLDKTGECMDQISSLLQKRSVEDGEGHVVVTTSSSSGSNKLMEGAGSTGSYYTSAHVKTEEVRQPSILIGGDLKEYQLAGLQWLVSLYNNKLNGILADEMGLGKTIQTISLLAYLMECKENLGPYLVIVPLSTMSNWVNEFAKWCPSARVVVYKGNPQQRKELYREEVAGGHFNVLLTTYEYIIRDKASLRKVPWQYAIVDEGHRMKNAQSKFAVILGTQYTTKHRILLTGTPLQNNLPELWALLNFLLPTIFNSVETFDQWFNRPFAQFGSGGGASSSAAKEETGSEEGSDDLLSNEERMLIIHRLHELLRPFMLRRVKSEVLDQLPEKVEKVLRCELSSWQKALYKQISASATSDKSLINGTNGQGGAGGATRGLNNVVMQLRKVCNHPYLFSPEGYHINDDLIRCSGKMELLDRMLPKLKAAGHRVLMFTQMTAAMTILEDYFAYRGYASLRLDGSTPAEERERRMYKFNAPDSPYFIFLLSTRAGGLGLNLATADTVVIFDSDWNPMMDLQAQDRAHRIGQRNDVRVFRLITNSPVEEKILSRATEKLNMSELVVEAGKFDKSSVEDDNSQERLKMMEVLLTDFDTTATAAAASVSTQPDGSSSELAEDDNGGPETETSSVGNDDREMLNEMLSSNDADYKLYCSIDERIDEGTISGAPSLATDPDDVPDWIRYPEGKKKDGENANESNVAGEELPSKRRTVNRTVTYNDGLTERQFVRLIEKEAEAEENAAKKRKLDRLRQQKKENEGEVSSRNGRKRKRNSISSASPAVSSDDNASDEEVINISDEDDEKGNSDSDASLSGEEMIEPPPKKEKGDEEGLSDATNRILIKICKSIAAYREAATKRLVSEIFLEKPCEKTYPDYYQIIAEPMAINDILRKCKSKLYSKISEFMDDWRLIFSNARIYNADGSWVVVDAGTLEVELKRLMKKNDLEEKTVSKPAKQLRIKLSLKTPKDGDSATPKNHSKKGKKKTKRNKRPRNSTRSPPPTENDYFEASVEDSDESSVDDEDSSYSGIVGMDERSTSSKKNKLRSGLGVGGGPGSRGGKGSYRKRK